MGREPQKPLRVRSTAVADDDCEIRAGHKGAHGCGLGWFRMSLTGSRSSHRRFVSVRFDKMMAENSDDCARSLIRDIQVLAETLLKHVVQQFDPAFVRQPEATFGRMIEWIAARNDYGQPPYGDHVFGQLVAVKSSYPVSSAN